jgi:hypothetical protein
MFGHKLCYEIKVTFGEISLKLCQTNWNVAKNNVNVVVIDELPSQIAVYTCLTIPDRALIHVFNNPSATKGYLSWGYLSKKLEFFTPY